MERLRVEAFSEGLNHTAVGKPDLDAANCSAAGLPKARRDAGYNRPMNCSSVSPACSMMARSVLGLRSLWW